MKVLNLTEGNLAPVYFQESAGRFGEWLDMKEKESKVPGSVSESLEPGKWE